MSGKLLYTVITSSTFLVALWGAQRISSFSEFQAMPPGQLTSLAVKLTYVGAQRKAVPTVIFSSGSNTVEGFSLLRHPGSSGLSYANDSLPARSFAATAAELAAVVNAAGSIPNVTAGGAVARPLVSFALLDRASGNGFEALLDKPGSDALLAALHNVLGRNTKARSILTGFGCAAPLREPGAPSDVTANVEVAFSGLRLNRTTGRFVGTATLKNVSHAPIAGPISLVLDLDGGVQVTNASGFTCGAGPVAGSSYINIHLPENSLPSGGTAQVNLDLNNPESHPIRRTHRVLAGAGGR